MECNEKCQSIQLPPILTYNTDTNNCLLLLRDERKLVGKCTRQLVRIDLFALLTVQAGIYRLSQSLSNMQFTRVKKFMQST